MFMLTRVYSEKNMSIRISPHLYFCLACTNPSLFPSLIFPSLPTNPSLFILSIYFSLFPPLPLPRLFVRAIAYT